MNLGPVIRSALPPRVERWAAGVYRSVFVDLGHVADCLARQLHDEARLLDIGGGDGELVNKLLRRKRGLCVTMVDVAGSVGKFVLPAYRHRVTSVPGTTVEAHVRGAAGTYDAALVSDVVHHLPGHYRAQFLRSVHAGLAPGGSIFIKDIEPGSLRAKLCLLGDVYVSGDRGVSQVSQRELQALARECLPAHRAEEIGLYALDRPNYVLKLAFG